MNWENPVAVATCLLVRNAKIVLVRAKTRGNDWGLPSGFVELNESAEDAIIREIKEETNLDASVSGWLGTYPRHNGRKKILLIAYEAEASDGGSFTPNSEISEIGEFEPEAALKIVNEPEEKGIIEKWLGRAGTGCRREK